MNILILLLTVLIICDIFILKHYIQRYRKYEKALIKIASAEEDMNKMVSIAIKALNNVESS